MKTTIKKQFAFKPLTLTIALTVIFFIGNFYASTQAQPAATGTGVPQGSSVPVQPGSTPPSTEVVNNMCQVELRQFLTNELQKYRDFLETNFQNKSATALLLDNALGRYREFRAAAMKKYATYFPQQGASQLTEGLQPGACLQVLEENLQEARRLLESRARTSSAVKKTTALITKYQDINNQLRTLNQSFITMKAYLDTFAAKLPCYIRKSCNKG